MDDLSMRDGTVFEVAKYPTKERTLVRGLLGLLSQLKGLFSPKR